ncbi:MAG: methyltransferase domain-containing protein [Pseudomonadota bacterium]
MAKISFKTRLRAWWEGYDVADLIGDDEGDFADIDSQASCRQRSTYLKDWEIEAAQKLWGSGRLGPLDGPFLRNLYLPFNLNETKSVLEIGSELGAFTRMITQETKAYVTGLEADPLVASHGMHISKVAGVSKEAAIGHFDPEEMVLDRRYDAIISICALYSVKRKDQAIEAIASAIKPLSNAQFIEFILMEGAEEHPDIVAWRDFERRVPRPWPPGRLQARLKEVGFTVKTADDCTAQYQQAAMGGFLGMLERLSEVKSDENVRHRVLDDTELWVRRFAALNSGGLRVMRVLGETPPTFGT